MTDANASRWINTVLALLAGLLSGLILGYSVGHNTSSFDRATVSPVTQRNDTIAPVNSWIVEGLTCPMPGCMNPLLVCQRRIREWVNEQLKLGRPGEDIRTEIIRVHASNVRKAMPGAPPDTQGAP